MEVLTLGKNFFFQMALNNIKRDKRMYLPFGIASTAFVSIYFMVITIMKSKGIADIPAGRNLQDLFRIGMVIMNVMTIIFMLYINSFLIKRRKKEFGLYGILGLEKRHVGNVILWENFIVSMVSMVLGILCGIIFGKLIFLIIFYTLKVSVHSRFLLPPEAFAYTVILFLGIFIVTSLFNLLQVSLANPIDLLKGDHMGEKKVRFILAKTFLGTALLGWAYYSASTVNSVLTALIQFMLAVLAVIAATFLLFEAGSLFILTVLKSRKKIFYKANNFIAISGLFHRMKQNAAGLASICILATMVLVTVSTSTALYLGQEDILKHLNPNDMEIKMNGEITSDQEKQLKELITGLAEKNKATISKEFGYDYINTSLLLKGGTFLPVKSQEINSGTPEIMEYMRDIYVITLKEYNEICGREETLQKNEILVLTGHEIKKEHINSVIAGEYKVKALVPDTELIAGKNGEVDSTYFFVTADKEDGIKLLGLIDPDRKQYKSNRNKTLNLDGNKSNLTVFAKELRVKSLKIKNVIHFNSIYTAREEGYGLYGGLLFLGIFFTILFLVATVLIIYFKQVSEGYDDKERFLILQKVGMDDLEVKRTINKQILIVFFLPLFGALLHVTMARHMIMKLLQAFYLFNNNLTTLCMAVTCLIFILAYIFVYGITAKTYYKIVKW
jgi:putative ABC transport system permease protein